MKIIIISTHNFNENTFNKKQRIFSKKMKENQETSAEQLKSEMKEKAIALEL